MIFKINTEMSETAFKTFKISNKKLKPLISTNQSLDYLID